MDDVVASVTAVVVVVVCIMLAVVAFGAAKAAIDELGAATATNSDCWRRCLDRLAVALEAASCC